LRLCFDETCFDVSPIFRSSLFPIGSMVTLKRVAKGPSLAAAVAPSTATHAAALPPFKGTALRQVDMPQLHRVVPQLLKVAAANQKSSSS
jgi:hypothetical protein